MSQQEERERYLKRPYVGSWRVLHGIHTESYDESGSAIIVKAGEVIHSRYDLDKHNSPGAKKFEKLPGLTKEQIERLNGNEHEPRKAESSSQESNGKTVLQTGTLDEMTVDELKKFAHEEGIDIRGLVKKQDIIDAINSAS